MLHNWRSVVYRLLPALMVLVLTGLLFDNIPLVLVLGLAAYLAYMVHQLLKLEHWLQDVSKGPSPPPEARGIWGTVFDSIYSIQRREQQAADHLKNIISRAQESTAAIDIAVVMLDRHNSLEWWNNAAEKLLGFKTPQDHRQTVTNLIREPQFVEYFQAGRFRTPLQLQSPVNPRLMLEYQITSFGEGEHLMVVRNITQLHKLESMRKDFIANVSHELRTPITVITGYLETMLDERTEISARWHKPLEQMYQQSRRMENIIRDLLTLSRLETGAVSREQESLDVVELLSEIIQDAEQVYAAKGHSYQLKTDGCRLLRGEPNELYSAFSNLILNAAKYTPAGGEITVSSHTEKAGLFVEVSDNGVGIAAEHLPRLTERFYRVDESRSTDTGGTGLGLAIVKHVLARHDGRLEIRSTPGTGSSFICHFPPERVCTDS